MPDAPGSARILPTVTLNQPVPGPPGPQGPPGPIGGGDRVPLLRQIRTVNSLRGGGSLGANLSLDLVGDLQAPGSTMLYGTDASGVRGWYPQPAGGGGGAVSSVFGRTGAVIAQTGDYSATNVGLGNVTNDLQIRSADFPSSSVDSELALFSGITGKMLKRASLSGVAFLTSGVLSVKAIGTDIQAWDADLNTWAGLTPSADLQTMVPHTFAQMRTDLGLVIGTNVQAYNANLDTWSTIAPATGIGTFLAVPSSANLAAAVTNETGSGLLVFATSPTLTTPLLGTPTSGVLTNCTGYTEANLSLTDITTNNASTSQHGFLKKLDNNSAHFMDGTGAWSTPAGGGGGKTILINSSTSTVSAAYAADTYLAGSSITVSAGAWNALGQYHCVFDMTKTAAGVAPIVITVRMGTAGTTADAAIATITFGTQAAATDTGIFHVWITFRTVGSGTSAVIQVVAQVNHKNATGFDNSSAQPNAMYNATSAGFDSTTPTILGISFNGGTAFSGTNTLVQATLTQ